MQQRKSAAQAIARQPIPKVLIYTFALFIFAALLMSAPARATNSTPAMFLTTVFSDLVGEYQALEQTPSSNEIQRLFADILSPHIDYLGLARWTLRDHWDNSGDIQRSEFLLALEKHVIKTYASALSFDRNSSLSVDSEIKQGKKLIQVSGTFSTPDAGTTDVLFRLIDADGNWQIFDVGVHGISVAKTLRADFTAIANRGGIDAVTAALSSGSLRLVSQR